MCCLTPHLQTFATLCKRGEADLVAKYLEHTPGLLNCLEGEPLRQATLGRNIVVVEMLLARDGILVNLMGELSIDIPFKVQKKDFKS